jgi:hypothetical protein
MSFSQPRRYEIKVPVVWGDAHDEYLCDIMMSAIPSKEDIIDVLRKNGELRGYKEESIEKMRIERPDGWFYKTILVFGDTSSVALWKIVPKP